MAEVINGVYFFRKSSGGGTSIANVICSTTENTPQGVSWTSGGSTITGTLAASASTISNRYFVLAAKTKTKNTYKEYVTIQVGDAYQWEELGTVDLDLDGYLQKGSNVLTQGHLLVTDSGGNVADSGKTTADLQDVIYGYLYNGVFYEDSAHATAITPSTTKQYVDMTTATAPAPYMWNGTSYIGIGGGEPEADEETEQAAAAGLVQLYNLLKPIIENGQLNNYPILVARTGVSVFDNLTSDLANYPLSAKQGKVLKDYSDENELTAAAGMIAIVEMLTLVQSIAPKYSAATTYNVGDYITQNGLLWKANTAISTPELFNASHWTQTTVMAEVAALISAAIS